MAPHLYCVGLLLCIVAIPYGFIDQRADFRVFGSWESEPLFYLLI